MGVLPFDQLEYPPRPQRQVRPLIATTENFIQIYPMGCRAWSVLCDVPVGDEASTEEARCLPEEEIQ